MKKILFFVALVALVMGTAVDASAKVKKTKKRATITTTTSTRTNTRNTTIQQGMFTNDGATRYANGDVADLEMAFLQDLYMEYVYTGNIANESYFRYVKPKFTDGALEMLKDEDGNYDWTIITGKKDGSAGITPSNFFIKRFGQCFEVSGGEHKCYFKVGGEEGAYKVIAVSSTPL